MLSSFYFPLTFVKHSKVGFSVFLKTVSFGFCAGGFAGLADFKKMLHGVWGRELPQDKSAKHTMLPQALRLDRLEGDAHLRKCSAEAFRGRIFLRWQKLLYYSCSSPRLMPCIALYALPFNI